MFTDLFLRVSAQCEFYYLRIPFRFWHPFMDASSGIGCQNLGLLSVLQD